MAAVALTGNQKQQARADLLPGLVEMGLIDKPRVQTAAKTIQLVIDPGGDFTTYEIIP